MDMGHGGMDMGGGAGGAACKSEFTVLLRVVDWSGVMFSIRALVSTPFHPLHHPVLKLRPFFKPPIHIIKDMS